MLAQAATMIATARKRIADGIAAAENHLAQVQQRELSSYEAELWAASQSFDSMLNTTTDFFTGWADSLTFGLYMEVLGDTDYLNQVDPNSNAFLAGQIVGAVHQVVAGAAAGSGACQVGRLVQAVRVYGAVGTGVGVGRVVAKAWREGVTSLNVFDYLALAPAAGKALGMMNRMCFVAGTPVVIGFDRSGELQIAALPMLPGMTDAASESTTGWNTSWLLVAAGVLATQQLLLAKKRRQKPAIPVATTYAGSPNTEHDRDLQDWWSDRKESGELLQGNLTAATC